MRCLRQGFQRNGIPAYFILVQPVLADAGHAILKKIYKALDISYSYLFSD
jgi:hypothetical protein